jgi:hypothetical protein
MKPVFTGTFAPDWSEAFEEIARRTAAKRARILAVAPETTFVDLHDEVVIECATEHRDAVVAILMNETFLAAQQAYLLANGWTREGDGRDAWREPPGRRGRTLVLGHAVNSQLQRDHCTICGGHYDHSCTCP